MLGHVATGSSNGKIVARLFISTKAVSVHASNILAKLGAGGRTEAAASARAGAAEPVITRSGEAATRTTSEIGWTGDQPVRRTRRRPFSPMSLSLGQESGAQLHPAIHTGSRRRRQSSSDRQRV